MSVSAIGYLKPALRKGRSNHYAHNAHCHRVSAAGITLNPTKTHAFRYLAPVSAS